MSATKITTPIMLAGLIGGICLANLPEHEGAIKEAIKADTMFPDGLTHDFGKVPFGTQLKHGFRVVNTSKVPLRLISVRPTGCRPSYIRASKSVLQPGETGKVEIVLDGGRFVGSRTYAYWLTTDDGKETVFRISASSERDPQP